MKFICTKKCYHGGILYRIGSMARFKRPQDGPKNHDGKLIHFEKISEAAPIEEKSDKLGPKVKVNEKEV